MKIFKKILIGLVSIMILLVIVSFFLDAKVSATRTYVFKASKDVVYLQFADLKNWEKWSPWKERDSTIEVTYNTESTMGKDASYSWTSKEQESGTLTITKAVENDSVLTELLIKGFGKSYGIMTLQDTDSGTVMTWSMNKDFGMNPIGRFFGLFFDDMVGADFERGMELMDSVVQVEIAEAATKTNTTENLSVVEMPEMLVVYTKVVDVNGEQEITDKYAQALEQLNQFISSNNLSVSGPPMGSYPEFDPTTMSGKMLVGFPVAAFPETESEAFDYVTMPAGKCLKYTMEGSYDGMIAAYGALYTYQNINGLQPAGTPETYEVYIRAPSDGVDESEYLTEIVMPLAETGDDEAAL